MDVTHDGSTRWKWTAQRLEELFYEPQSKATYFAGKVCSCAQNFNVKEDAMDDDPED